MYTPEAAAVHTKSCLHMWLLTRQLSCFLSSKAAHVFFVRHLVSDKYPAAAAG
jgi:hypothetical protein